MKENKSPGVDGISPKIRYSPPALYILQEYVPTGGGCFMFMACSTLYEMTISVVCSVVSLL